jgi:hypothetical protein
MISIILPICMSFIIGLFVATTYHFTKKGFSHSQSFIKNLVLLTVITCVVMLVIGNNVARAFSLVGALSIIRFRTPLKDPLDIGFVFYALAMGMATGTRSYEIGIVACILISIMFFFIYKINFGSTQKIDYLLKMHKNQDTPESLVESVLKKYVAESTLVNLVKPSGSPEMEATYMVLFKKNTPENRQSLIDELNAVPGMQRLIFINKAMDIEG